MGAFVIYSTVGKKNAEPPVAAVTPPQPKQEIASATPQLPVESPDATVQEEPPAAEAEKEIVESKPKVKPPVQKPVARQTPPRRRTPPPPRKPVVKNRVIISSSPSGASLSIDGQKVGTTPYTWSTPVFGKVTLKLSKSGYKDTEKSFEFTGGSVTESVTMDKQVAAPPPPPPPEKKEPVVESTPRESPPPPMAEEDIDDPFADIGDVDDNFTLEPEEPKTAVPAVKSPVVTPSARGGEALIFIASIPPVADVYLNDKLIGKTNVSELKIPAGVQTLKFVKGGKEITKQLNLQAGKNPSQMVRIP